eukprot:1185484-Prorocentrum_minimum.AAC.2
MGEDSKARAHLPDELLVNVNPQHGGTQKASGDPQRDQTFVTSDVHHTLTLEPDKSTPLSVKNIAVTQMSDLGFCYIAIRVLRDVVAEQKQTSHENNRMRTTLLLTFSILGHRRVSRPSG